MLWDNGGFYPKVQYTCEDYADLVTTEEAIRKLDRIHKKIAFFNKRSILDPSNHERREQRMLDRVQAREVAGLVHFVQKNLDE